MEGQLMTIANCASSQLNGAFPIHVEGFTTFSYQVSGASTGLSCFTPSPSTAPTFTHYNGNFIMYPRAQITSVYDQAQKRVDGVIAVEPNNVNWSYTNPTTSPAPTATIEVPHWHQPALSDVQNFVQSYTKLTQEPRGKTFLGIVTGNVFGDRVDNDAPLGQYEGYGGTESAPRTARYTEGWWSTYSEINQAPNGSLFSVDLCKPDPLVAVSASIYPEYSASVNYSSGSTATDGANIYVATVASSGQPLSSGYYWQKYNGCTFENRKYQVLALTAASGKQQLTFDPLTSNLTFINGSFPCQTTISGYNGLSVFSSSGAPCGNSAPYFASSAPGDGAFSVSGCSAGGPEKGGPSAGQFTIGSSPPTSCSIVVSMGQGAATANGWSCWMNDLTAHTSLGQSGFNITSSPQTVTFFGPSLAGGDLVNFGCMGY